ncbi:NADPH:quinone reductase [Streptomyces brasiliensis]|uniref:Oxidoreductase n=1 Tax=Streptomyces brasiliensis TaxID=1954 RepID=A0A917K314_9ACTN|nr:NADPH:quinone reductase [Streptomyces brasiliensis]GGI95713.1 oxidoreductase [Streptomyces brasiliensis]
MRAAYITELGGPDVIRCGELPSPRPGPHDVLVDVEVSAVNPVDGFVRSGAYRTPLPFPFVIGRDLVGTVAEAGPAGGCFRPGDRVWCNSLGHAGRQGAAAERAVVPADRLYRLPEGVSAVDAVALAHSAATAHLALFTHGGLRTGETVAVLGAAGNVGSALVVMAARSGARVIAVASDRDETYVRLLGAAGFVDYRSPDAPGLIRAAAPEGVDVLVDTSGRNDLGTMVELLADRGRIVVMSGLDSRPVLPVGALYTRDRSIRGFAISHADTVQLAGAARHINSLLAAGHLRPRAVEELPLGAAAEAHRRMERDRPTAKLVLRVRG